MSDCPCDPVVRGAGEQRQADWRRVAAVAFLSQGTVGVCQKALSEIEGEYRLLFLFFTYVVAAGLSIALFRMKSAALTWGEVLLGSMAGVTCVLSVYFLLAALKTVPGMVVFMVVPASALGLTLLTGWLVFKERLSRAQTVGVLLALAGIILVQM